MSRRGERGRAPVRKAARQLMPRLGSGSQRLPHSSRTHMTSGKPPTPAPGTPRSLASARPAGGARCSARRAGERTATRRTDQTGLRDDPQLLRKLEHALRGRSAATSARARGRAPRWRVCAGCCVCVAPRATQSRTASWKLRSSSSLKPAMQPATRGTVCRAAEGSRFAARGRRRTTRRRQLRSRTAGHAW